ncbi:hypothetical protein FRC08_001278 [Ceratobasidium sp. 394]|nr:hypothetical protein FRC08_001278 [Ceratobasidium sp. 394]KAG9093530.1 hypothetical protein FS749_014231 [Ceratobasidium sp. UAMH 11750]
MFFARLAVAALSFGSFAKVFAAPIAVDGLGVSIPENLPTQRRADIDFNNVLASAIATLTDTKGKVATLAADPTAAVKPEVAAALAQVAPTLATISSSLKATGAEDLAKLSTDSVAADMAVVMTTVSEIVGGVKEIRTVKVVALELENIKSEVDTLLAIVVGVLPTVIGLIKTVLGLVADALVLVHVVVGPILAGILSGGI